MPKCNICNKYCKTFRSLSYHIKIKHNVNSKDYYNLYLKKLYEGICIVCNSETTYVGLQFGYNKYCSTKCSNNDPIVKEKISKSMTEIMKNKDIRNQISFKMKGRIVSEEVKNKLKGKRKKIGKCWNKGIKNCYDLESLERMRKSQLSRFSKESEIIKISNSQKNYYLINKKNRKFNFKIGMIPWNKGLNKNNDSRMMKISETLKNSEFMKIHKKRMINGQAAYMNKFIKNPSKPEIQLRELVKELYPNCEFQHQILNYSIDIALPDHKIAIEYDGWYHFNSQESIDYHNKRQKEIEDEGWKFVRYNIYQKFPSITKISDDVRGVIIYDNSK